MRSLALFLTALAFGCDSDPTGAESADRGPDALVADAGPGDGQPADGPADALAADALAADAVADVAPPAPDADPGPPERGWIGHDFGSYPLRPFEETLPCVQWTLDNDRSIYVETVELETGGAFHHSNWYVVPEDSYPGDDGFFACYTRDFNEAASALAGTVLFAQSTQARYEAQTLEQGVVIKIPPRHKLIAAAHLLNASGQPVETTLRMGLTLLHPRAVKLVVAPVRISYYDLEIPPRSEAHFTARCDLRRAYERATGAPFDLKLYWALPHYHGLGNYYALTIVGGEADGEVLHRLQDFDAEGNGKAFSPPVDLSGADGLSATCGYLNPRRQTVTYGIGEREMCDTLLFADAQVMMDATVFANSQQVGERDGIKLFEGPCHVTALPRSRAQTHPDADEIAAPLYLPPFDDIDRLRPGPSDCVDTPADAIARVPATLDSVRDIFRASCTYSACHGNNAPAAGLDLRADDLAAVLQRVVVPGDAEASTLYQRISRCEPVDAAGNVRDAMPRNAPVLLDPGLVAAVRDWIEAGAPASP